MSGIHQMKQILALKCSSAQESQEEINQRMEQIVSEATSKINRIYLHQERILISD